jgi:FtsP/CotA-like multicopper oxidase with cupredoxin domain
VQVVKGQRCRIMFSYFADVLTHIARVLLCLSVFPLFGEMGQYDPALDNPLIFTRTSTREAEGSSRDSFSASSEKSQKFKYRPLESRQLISREEEGRYPVERKGKEISPTEEEALKPEEKKPPEEDKVELNESYEQEFSLVFSDWVDRTVPKISFDLMPEGNHYALIKGGEPAWWDLEDSEAGSKRGRSWWVSSELVEEPEQSSKRGRKVLLKIKNLSITGSFDFRLSGRKMVVIKRNKVKVKPERVEGVTIEMGDIYEIVVVVKDEKPITVSLRHWPKEDLNVAKAIKKHQKEAAEEVSQDEKEKEQVLPALESELPVLAPKQEKEIIAPAISPVQEEKEKEPILLSENQDVKLKKSQPSKEPKEIVQEVKKELKQELEKKPETKLKEIPSINLPTSVKVVPEFIPKDIEEYKVLTPISEKEEVYDYRYVLVFAEWEDKSISQVTVNLKKGGNYYGIIKDGIPAWINLENSKTSPSPSMEKRIHLKLRNVSISRELDLDFPGRSMKILAHNGRKVESTNSENIKIEVGDSYDVMLVLDDEKPFQVRAKSGNRERLNPSRPMEDRISLIPMKNEISNIEKKMIEAKPVEIQKEAKVKEKENKKRREKLQMPTKPLMPKSVLERDKGFKRKESEGLVEYEIPINYKTVNYTGKDVRAFSVGGDIVAPTITAKVGDILRVTFHNTLDQDTSVHWHGVLVPNDQDGVPYLTTPPIKAHSSFTYQIPVRHSGTYWYHSHTGLQRQRGIYGAMVFYPKERESSVDEEHVLVFSDWNDESPEQTLANLKKDGDYYALKKDSVVSWGKILKRGSKAVHNQLRNSWERMGPMDVSDVGYDAFLVNGRKGVDLPSSKGKKHRLRLINASASTYFNVEFSGGFMTVVAADGIDVEPFDVQRLRISIAETYDVIVTIPGDKSYEFRASAEDGTGFTSAYLGHGEKILAPTLSKPDILMGRHGDHGKGHMDEMENHSDHHDKEKSSVLEYMTDYDSLKSLEDTTLPEAQPWREFELRLTGNMESYVWSFNDKTLSEADTIKIKKGENVRFILKNDTMMHHPVHLHGHFFRVLNKQGKRSPLKHTVNVEPMATTLIEFDANEEKDWFFHCHNLYHMASGMSLVVGYEGSSQMNDQLLSRISHDSRFFYKGELGIESNMISGMLQASNPRNVFALEFDNAYGTEYEIETRYSRRVSRFLDVYVGGQLLNEREDGDEEQEEIRDRVKVNNSSFLGIHYVLPLLIEADFRIDSDGKVLFGLESGLQLTDRVKFSWHWNSDWEYRLKLAYEINKRLSLSASLDSDFHGGGGITFKF